MAWGRPDPKSVAQEYLEGRWVVEDPPLGSGTDGIVYFTSRRSAIKIYGAQRLYAMELAVYQRLRKHGVESICGHAVPRLLGWDDRLMVLEMSCVDPPYILDFAKCRIGSRFEFEAGGEEAWLESIKELFDDNWETALEIQMILWHRYQIYYADLKPGNVEFAI